MRIAVFAWYRLKIILGNPRDFIMLLLLPPLAVLLLGQVINTSLDPGVVPVAVTDLDQSEYSRLVVARMAAKPAVILAEMDEEAARRGVITHRLEAAFIIKQGFMEDVMAGRLEGLVQLLRSPSTLSPGALGELIASEVVRLSSNVTAADMVTERYSGLQVPAAELKSLWMEAWAFTDAQWEPEPLMTVTYRQDGTVQPGEEGFEAGYHRGGLAAMFGLITALIMFLAVFLQEWLVEEKNNGMISRIRANGVNPSEYVLGNSLAVPVLLWGTTLPALVVLSLFSPVPVFLPSVILLLLFYSFTCYAGGLLLATRVCSSGQLQAAGLLVVLLTSIFGGSFLNLAEVTARFAFASFFTPQGWVLAGIQDALFYSKGWAQLWKPLAVLAGMGYMFLWCSGKRDWQ